MFYTEQVSPHFGFLPLKTQFLRVRDNKLGTEIVLSDLIQLPNGLWYPQRIRTGSPDPKEAITYTITRISIEPIPGEVFTPKIPPGTFVHDHVAGLVYTTEAGDIDGRAVENGLQDDGVERQNALDQYVNKADELESEQANDQPAQADGNVAKESGSSSDAKGVATRVLRDGLGPVWKVVLLVAAVGILAVLLIWARWKKLTL
jgi:hypothetical protein